MTPRLRSAEGRRSSTSFTNGDTDGTTSSVNNSDKSAAISPSKSHKPRREQLSTSPLPNRPNSTSTLSTAPNRWTAKQKDTAVIAWNLIVRKWEIPRKALHVSIGFVTLYLYANEVEAETIRTPILMAFIPVVLADLLRFTFPQFNRLYISVLGFLMRAKEHDPWHWNGVIPYMIGIWTVLMFFPKDVAVVSILLLSWSDTAASTFGRLYGRNGPFLRPGKSLIGSLAAVVSGAFAAWLFWGVVAEDKTHVLGGDNSGKSSAWPSAMWNDSLEAEAGFGLVELCVLTGVVAGAAEAIDLWGLDDNITLPILSGTFLWSSLKALRWLTT